VKIKLKEENAIEILRVIKSIRMRSWGTRHIWLKMKDAKKILAREVE
jgi:hypothetical protein